MHKEGDCVTSALRTRIIPTLRNTLLDAGGCSRARPDGRASLSGSQNRKPLRARARTGAATSGCTTPREAEEESPTPSCSRPTALRAFCFFLCCCCCIGVEGGGGGAISPVSHRGLHLHPGRAPVARGRVRPRPGCSSVQRKLGPGGCMALMAPARTALRLRPSPLSAQSPPTC